MMELQSEIIVLQHQLWSEYHSPNPVFKMFHSLDEVLEQLRCRTFSFVFLWLFLKPIFRCWSSVHRRALSPGVVDDANADERAPS